MDYIKGWIQKRDPHKDVYRRGRDKGFTLMEVLVSLAIISIVFVIILEIFSQGLRSIGLYRDYNEELMKKRALLGKIWYFSSPEMLRKEGLTAKEMDVKNLYIVKGDSLKGEIYRFFAP